MRMIFSLGPLDSKRRRVGKPSEKDVEDFGASSLWETAQMKGVASGSGVASLCKPLSVPS